MLQRRNDSFKDKFPSYKFGWFLGGTILTTNQDVDTPHHHWEIWRIAIQRRTHLNSMFPQHRPMSFHTVLKKIAALTQKVLTRPRLTQVTFPRLFCTEDQVQSLEPTANLPASPDTTRPTWTNARQWTRWRAKVWRSLPYVPLLEKMYHRSSKRAKVLMVQKAGWTMRRPCVRRRPGAAAPRAAAPGGCRTAHHSPILWCRVGAWCLSWFSSTPQNSIPVMPFDAAAEEVADWGLWM